MRDLKLNKKNCLKSISFSTLGIIIFISEFISIIMNILLLVITNWEFLKKIIKILNVICLVILALTTLINIIMFCSIKNIKKDIIHKFTRKMVSTIFLLLFYIIIIIYNIFNAIYLTIRLHIADYPEYGGRKRDQEYIDSHPKEFGNVSLKEFIIAAICPSLISVFNLLLIIICILIRHKLILIYEDTYQKLNIKYSNNNNKHNKNKRYSANHIKSTDDFLNINNSAPINNKVKGNNDAIKIKINNSDDGDGYEIKLPQNHCKINFDSADNLNNAETKNNNNNTKEYNEKLPEKFFFGGKEIKLNKDYNLTNPQKIIINSMQGTKSTINDKKDK